MGRLLREFRTEIIAALLIIVGVFLLVEQIELRVFLLRVLSGMTSAVKTIVDGTSGALVRALQSIRPSDLIGVFLIALALVILSWRVRWRLMRSDLWTGESCP